MALIFDTVRTENFHTHGSTNNARFTADAWGTKHQTDNGYILFGPANSSHAHIYTDRANFYFNKQIQVLGVTTINQNDIRTPILYDYNDTGYYVNPAGTSNLSALNVGGYPVLTANTGGVFTDGDLTLNMSNDDGLVYDDSNNTMYVKADGSNYAIIDSRGGTISGVLTMNGGGQKIALNNGDITGVNQITINDPGEGIVWQNGSSGSIALATIDDSSDNILNVSGTGATLAVNGVTVLTTSTGITNSGNDTRTGNLELYGTNTNGTYGNAPIELKEVNQVGTAQSAYQYAPAIAWHWGGRKQMQMRLHSDGHLYVDGSNYGQSKVWTAGNDGSGSGLDADTLDGFQLDSSSNTGARASVIPYIKSDSVMEIGKYLDFHDTGSTADYDIRLSSSSARLNVDGGYFQVNGVNSVRASFFYDLDNTNYYLNPAGQSLFGSGDSPELKLGPNTSYSKYLYLGGWGTSKGDGGWVRTSNGNLHLEGANPGGGVYLNHYVNANVYLANGGGYAYIYNSARAPIFYDLDNTTYYTNPASRSELTATNMSLNDATALTNGAFNVSKTIKGGIHFTNGAGTGSTNGYQASITFQGSSAGESQAGIYVHNNNSAGTHMALATTNSYSNGPQIALRIDNNGKIFADRNFIQSDTDMRAPSFYDSNNTGYYLNPAASSKLVYLGLATDPNTSGSYRLNMGGSIDMNNNAVHYLSELHFQDNVRFYDEGNDSHLIFKWGDSGAGGIKFIDGDGTLHGSVYGNGSGGFGLLDKDNHWMIYSNGTNETQIRANNNVEFYVYESYVYAPGSMRSPIFYDSDNTAYYINGATTSYLNTLNVNTIDADNFKQLTDGVPRNNLGSPTVTEMALFDRQFGPKTTLANNYDNLSDLRFYKQDTSSSAWEEITTYSDDQKRRFLRTANSSVIIPYGVYKFRVEFKAPGYVYANAMYGYWSSNGHNTQIQVWKYNLSTSSWSQHTSATNTISSWPGHMYLPFATIPWHETNTTSTNHFSDIRFEFTPNWNTSYSSNNINLSGMEVWGGYPAGKRDIHSYDQDGRFIAWGDVHVGNGDLYASKIYDYNNTGYYLDPNSTGYSVRIAGDIGMNNGYRLWFSSGDTNWQFGRNIYSASGESLTGNAVQLKVYGASDQGFQILDHNNVAKHEFSGDGNAYFDGSVTAPIFYDSGNTGYYVNPQGTSKVAILLVEDQIRTGNGQQLVLNAGESYVYATGQTGENVYVNAENGLQVNSSPDNWGSGWAGRYTATICDAAGNSYFPGRVQASEFFTSGKVIHTGDTDTYTEFNAANTWRVVVGGSQKVVVNSNGLTASNGNLYSSIFYDSDNTSFYLNPSSTTSIYDLIVGSGLQIAQRDWTGNIGTGQNYVASSTSTSNRGNYGGGVWSYSGYSTGTNRPHTYDATLQVMAGDNMGFELSADWLATNKTPLKIRSLRDCCQGWSTWVEVMTQDHVHSGNFFTTGSMRAGIFYDQNDTGYFVDPAGSGNSTVLNGVKINYLGAGTSANTSGNYRINMGGSIDMNANNIDYINQLHFNDNVRFYDSGNDSYLDFKYGDAVEGGIRLRNGGNAQKGLLYANDSGFGLLSADGTWSVRTTDSYVYLYHQIRTPIVYDSDNTAYYVDPATTTQLNILNANSLDVNGNITANAYVSTDTSQSRAKFRLWDGSTSYSIGMNSGYTYGHLGDYAMAFQMNDDYDRGFWWGDTSHSNAQGAMSLTTTGQLTVATSVSIGEGESVTSPSTLPLYVSGNSALNGLVSIGSNLISTNTGLWLYYNNTTTGSEAMKITQTQYAGVHIRFIGQSGNQTGSIGYFGTSTTYNTSSDYRLKENVVPMTGAIDRVNQLKPSRFTWIGDPDAREVDGFIAHEVSEVVPEAITGVKDELDAEGNPLYQGIDQSKLVPLLTAALKEAIAKIEDLENRLQILENQ